MYPAVLMAAALAVGIAVADWLRPHPALALAAFVLAALWAGFAQRRTTGALLVALALFGTLRYAYVQTAGRGQLAAWEGQKVSLTGTVVGEPEVRPDGTVRYILAAERVDGEPTQGRVAVNQRGGGEPGYGERVVVQGALKPPQGARTPGGFDQAAYLARQSVYLTLDTAPAQRLGPGRLDPARRLAVAMRLRLERVLQATMPPRESALMAGLLFGTRSDLPADLKEAFKASGVFHLLAVSGGHFAILVMPLVAGLRRMGLRKRTAAAAAIPVVIAFVLLTGAGPSILRAGLMTVLMLLGDVLRRERNPLNTLGVAALLLLLWSPGLLFDAGFQLSAGATAGILLFARPIAERLGPWLQPWVGDRLGAWLAGGLSVTLAAQAAVEPISLHHFGTFSVIAPLANLLVLSLMELIVRVGLVATLVGVGWLSGAWVLQWPVRACLWAMVFLVKAAASLPFAMVTVGNLPLWGVAAWYGVLAFIASPRLREEAGFYLARLVGYPGLRRTGAAALACAVALLGLGYAWRLALAAPPDQLKVTFMDVGQGDAILIEAPGGRRMLIDAGPAQPADPARGRPGFDAGESVVLPHLARHAIRWLDYLVLTHPDLDHVGGAPAILQGISVGALLVTNPGAPDAAQAEALAQAKGRAISIQQPVAGQRLELGPGVLVEVLNPSSNPHTGTRSDDNANCLALRLRYRQVAMLFACDMEAVAEERLVAEGEDLQADLLKVSHHGSKNSSTPAFLAAVQPRHAIISAGVSNPYGHPHRDALSRLEEAGATIHRTDRHGAIIVRTDGFALKVEGAKGSPADDRYRPLALLGRRLFAAW